MHEESKRTPQKVYAGKGIVYVVLVLNENIDVPKYVYWKFAHHFLFFETKSAIYNLSLVVDLTLHTVPFTT